MLQLTPEFVAHRRELAAAIQIGELEWIALEVVELIELAGLAAIDPVNIFVAVGAYGLVGHADKPRHRLLSPVFDQDRLAPCCTPSTK